MFPIESTASPRSSLRDATALGIHAPCRDACDVGDAGGGRGRRGFTLVELMIVVTVLGLLAGVAVPHFRTPVSDAKEATLLFQLTEVRTAVERYRVQHDDAWPVLFATQLSIATDARGVPGGRCGPYLRNGFPVNPVNESALVKEVVTMPSEPDGSTGWLLEITTGQFRANLAGPAPSGKAYFDL